MSTPLPSIYPNCRRLLVPTEDMVLRFSCYHKYTLGTDLRQSAMGIMRTVNQAVYDKPRQAQHVQALVWRGDDYKPTPQLSMGVGLFAPGQQGSAGGANAAGISQARVKARLSFQNFEQAATLAAAVGKQCGSWVQVLARRLRRRAEQAAPSGMASAGAGSQPAPPVQYHPASLSGCATSVPLGSAELLGPEGKP
ncbi:hypothetical protein [Limnohabitans sp. WS1]|uniref:hypothetical protein n=1 Tax=Limnohabitans sp. WS1 TaxID=1100726 RepID=UPI0011B27515|nr:hypothetical protein [Limnohabitans sp. WS1]